jgi:hypothetical protein
VSSFISAFRPILVALGVIACLEAAVAVFRHPDDVERSNFLIFSYLRPEIGQRLFIYEKLRKFGRSSPDVIQIGDSSGFYGVNPRLVARYLGGLDYVNLNCCAVMGFDGYYAVAHFMLRHNPSIKAIVLYMSPLNFLDSQSDDSFADPLQSSFDSLKSYVMPPSLALRRDVTESAYTLGGLGRTSANDNPEIERRLRFIRDHNGWFPEDDIRLSGKALDRYWHDFCGPDLHFVRNDAQVYYSHGLLARRESQLFVKVAHLADLAAGYGAKLILIMHPLPCAFGGTAFDARARDLARLRSQYPNLVVAPADAFFRLPTEMFSSVAHLRIGNEIPNSRRVGLAVADALGVRAAVPDDAANDPEPALPIADKNTPLTWSAEHFDEPVWAKDGVTTLRAEDGTRVTEVKSLGWHRVTTQVGGIEPNNPYSLSVLVKPGPNRTVWLELSDGERPGNYGRADFDLDTQTSIRVGDIIDLDIETLPGGWFRCWASMQFRGKSVAMSVVLATKTAVVYQGDGESSITVRKAALRSGARLSADAD